MFFDFSVETDAATHYPSNAYSQNSSRVLIRFIIRFSDKNFFVFFLFVYIDILHKNFIQPPTQIDVRHTATKQKHAHMETVKHTREHEFKKIGKKIKRKKWKMGSEKNQVELREKKMVCVRARESKAQRKKNWKIFFLLFCRWGMVKWMDFFSVCASTAAAAASNG